MVRRRESIADLFLILPWWASIIAAIASFTLLVFLLPAWFSGNPDNTMLASVATSIAPFVAGAFVIIGIGSAVRAYLVRRNFDRLFDLTDIRSLPWQHFEMIVAEAFRRRGYVVIENMSTAADEGVDLALHKNGATYFVQCKQWRTMKVGVRPLREFFGVVSARAAAGGIFVSSGTYTRDALEFARESRLELIDGHALAQMVKQYQESPPLLDPTNFGQRANTTFESGGATPLCPQCDKPMVLRAAKRGTNAGSQFWGCTGSPQCPGTRMV
jgi:restriction system protein